MQVASDMICLRVGVICLRVGVKLPGAMFAFMYSSVGKTDGRRCLQRDGGRREAQELVCPFLTRQRLVRRQQFSLVRRQQFSLFVYYCTPRKNC
jgi:hypothetical protein